MSSEKPKELHTSFRVQNFIYSDSCHIFDLKPIHKLLLILLAKHSGPKGIYPSISTLAKELDMDERYIQRCLEELSDKKLLLITPRPGRSNLYQFLFLSTDPRSTGQGYSEDEVRSTDRGGYGLQEHNPRSTDRPININNQYRLSKQRGRDKNRATPLSDNFVPNKDNQELLKKKSIEVGLSAEDLITKFINHIKQQKGEKALSLDWQARFGNFIIGERAPLKLVSNNYMSYSTFKNPPAAKEAKEVLEENRKREKEESEDSYRRLMAELGRKINF